MEKETLITLLTSLTSAITTILGAIGYIIYKIHVYKKNKVSSVTSDAINNDNQVMVETLETPLMSRTSQMMTSSNVLNTPIPTNTRYNHTIQDGKSMTAPILQSMYAEITIPANTPCLYGPTATNTLLSNEFKFTVQLDIPSIINIPDTQSSLTTWGTTTINIFGSLSRLPQSANITKIFNNTQTINLTNNTNITIGVGEFTTTSIRLVINRIQTGSIPSYTTSIAITLANGNLLTFNNTQLNSTGATIRRYNNYQNLDLF